MSIFGRTDDDLYLLRLDTTDLEAAIEANMAAVENQIDQHCIRLAWRENARTGAPVRGLLRVVAGNAHSRLMVAVPNEEPEHDEDLLHALIAETQRKHELKVCLGFLLDAECRDICRGVAEGAVPQAGSILHNDPYQILQRLSGKPSARHEGHAALLWLRDLWSEYRNRVATDALTRETVRIVAAVTGRDPQLSGSFVLDSRLRLLHSWVADD